jgi:hypothetical protein
MFELHPAPLPRADYATAYALTETPEANILPTLQT